ncbi:ABC transporter substrate-binding protein [Microbacterium sp. No. 7]|uniref:ABC transporter substrate-binding protein n=1 Tax=Microbacterium sp. No. 7 TaxID=1714373 RepID=UPI0006D154AA|nr:ABC transporter substrate-binding protein [Microbacterium sp. No. 7]ALJ20670.1 ABC transporter substrate-binding protein [Microbacterium sp. No. 7]
MALSPTLRVAGALLAASAVALSLTSCFSGGTPATADGDDARISVAMLQPPRSGLTPLSDDAFKLSRWSTAETLVVLDEVGDAQPGLATAWEQVDDTTWRFTIRTGVTFHDGTALTAEQVAASLTAAAQASPLPRILNGVDLTATADGDAVIVTTADKDPLVPHRLSSPQLAILAAAAYGADGVVDPVGHGTGPFVLVDVDGTAGATLDRYDGYWGEPATAAGIDVAFVPDGTARAAALRTGTADVVEAVPVGQVAQIDESLIHEVPMPRTNTLYLNTSEGPFADPAVRAAAAAAIERATIVDTVYEGRADVAEGLLGPALPWAAGLRDDAGYRDELTHHETAPAQVDGVRITLGTFTDRAELPEVAVLIEQQLEAAGFVVEQDVREYQYIEADALDGAFDAFILSRATVIDSGDPVAYLTSDFTCAGTFNISQFCDPEVDALVAAASQTDAGEERRAAIMRAEAAILARHAAIPMLHERVIQGEAAGVSGVDRDPRERTLITPRSAVER